MAHINTYLANQRNPLIHSLSLSLSTTLHLKAGVHLIIATFVGRN